MDEDVDENAEEWILIWAGACPWRRCSSFSFLKTEFAHFAQKHDDKFMTKCQQCRSGKKLKKGVDKREKKCYNMRALNERRPRETRNRPSRCASNPEKRSRKSWKKLLKNLLTNEKRCDIMFGSLSERKEPRKKSRKKVEKTFEKPLDKWKEMWYNSRALPPKGEGNGSKEPWKKLKKLLKNPLTNKTECDIMCRSRKTRLERAKLAQIIDNWTTGD